MVRSLGLYEGNLKEKNLKSWDHEVDATNLRCPMPLLKMKQALNKAKVGEIILVKVTDSASLRDFTTFIEMTEHKLELKKEDHLILYWITKKRANK